MPTPTPALAAFTLPHPWLVPFAPTQENSIKEAKVLEDMQKLVHSTLGVGGETVVLPITAPEAPAVEE